MDIEKIIKETMMDAVNISFTGAPKTGKSRICGFSDDDGVMLIAEINLSELPDSCMLKGEGYLQFFIDAGLDIGRKFSGDGNCKVILADKPLDEKDMFEIDNPIIKPSGIQFAPCKEAISQTDITLRNYLSQEEIGEYWNSFEMGTGSKILGYPVFTQQDPRELSPQYDRLLLQLDSDKEHVMWGDAGVGNFFISSGALEKKDFSDVLFYWDCF